MRSTLSLTVITATALAVGCGSTTGVDPTRVSGGTITLPPNAVMYRRSAAIEAGSTINLGTQGSFGTDVVCAVAVAPDAEGMHRCNLTATILMNVDYWIYLDEPGRPGGVDFHDEFYVGSQKIVRSTQVCVPRGNCYFAGLLRIVNGDAKIQ